MKGERLELVTDFVSLRAGMIVVVKRCATCKRTHREMLISQDEDQDWTIAPVPACNAFLLGPEVAGERRLYRVVDGLEAPAETRSREVVR